MKVITSCVNLTLPQKCLSDIDVEHASILYAHNTYIVGDLHGNYIKLISALVHLGFIFCKTIFGNVSKYYDFIIKINLIIKEIHDVKNNLKSKETIERINRILDETFELIAQPKKRIIIFIGDTHCDRGPSDFVTFCIFQWMKKKNITYFVILGNHELTVSLGKAFTYTPDSEYFKFNATIPDNHRHFFVNSFDFFQLNYDFKEQFIKMYAEFWEHVICLSVLFEKESKTPILLTHAPASILCIKNLLSIYFLLNSEEHITLLDLINYPEDEVEFVEKEKKLMHFNRFICQEFIPQIRVSTEELNPLEKSLLDILNDFCMNRDMHGNLNNIVNIFGHMGYLSSERIKLPKNKICVDTQTGMPTVPNGEVVYACLNI